MGALEGIGEAVKSRPARRGLVEGGGAPAARRLPERGIAAAARRPAPPPGSGWRRRPPGTTALLGRGRMGRAGRGPPHKGPGRWSRSGRRIWVRRAVSGGRRVWVRRALSRGGRVRGRRAFPGGRRPRRRARRHAVRASRLRCGGSTLDRRGVFRGRKGGGRAVALCRARRRTSAPVRAGGPVAPESPKRDLPPISRRSLSRYFSSRPEVAALPEALERFGICDTG